MQFDKSQITDMLRSQGDNDKADQADKEMPQQVDTEKDKGLLDKFGINPQDLISKFTGGGGSGGGGIGGAIGGVMGR